MAKTAAKVLADNLNLLVAEGRNALTSQPKIAEKAKVGQRTVGRAMKGQVSTTIASIEGIAEAFKLSAWQLLHPTMGIMPKGEQNDPLVFQLIDFFGELSPESRHELTAHANHLVSLEKPGKTTAKPFNGVVLPASESKQDRQTELVAAQGRQRYKTRKV